MRVEQKESSRSEVFRHRPPTPGRPAYRQARQVADDILRAAEACLMHKSPSEISTKDITTLASTRPAMVCYYFGSKDGLLVEIVRRSLKDIELRFIETREAVRRNEIADPTRAMVAAFADVYNRKPALCRILISEVFRKGSPIREFFLREWPGHGNAMIVDVTDHLRSTGYYRTDFEVEDLRMLIYSVVFFPLIVRPSLMRDGNDKAEPLSEQWIDFVASVIDSYLRRGLSLR